MAILYFYCRYKYLKLLFKTLKSRAKMKIINLIHDRADLIYFPMF